MLRAVRVSLMSDSGSVETPSAATIITSLHDTVDDLEVYHLEEETGRSVKRWWAPAAGGRTLSPISSRRPLPAPRRRVIGQELGTAPRDVVQK